MSKMAIPMVCRNFIGWSKCNMPEAFLYVWQMLHARGMSVRMVNAIGQRHWSG